MTRPNEPRTVRLSSVLWGLLGVILIVTWIVLANWPFSPADGSGAATGSVPGAPGADVPVEAPAAATAAAAASARWTEALGAPPAWPADLAAPADCAGAEAAMAALCRAIDAQPPFADAGVAGGSCAAIRESLAAVARRSPHVSGELRSYGAILDNVFHVFRAIGRERLALLRSTVAARPALAEPAAMAVWRWTATRESCARSGATELDAHALYEQAAFALDTIGGNAYLRRRSPRVEALATFYAVLAVDRADRSSANEHGIDLRPSLARARALLAAEDLVFRDRYLETLDGIGRRWAARGDGVDADGRPSPR